MKASLCALALSAVLFTTAVSPSIAAPTVDAPAEVEPLPDASAPVVSKATSPGQSTGPVPLAAPTPATVEPTPTEAPAETPHDSTVVAPAETPTPESSPSHEASPAPTSSSIPASTATPEPTPSSTPAPSPEPTPVAPIVRPAKTERSWRVGVGFYYSGVNQLMFSGAQFNDLKYLAKFNLDNAWGFQFEGSYFREHSWGMQIGGMIDNQRSIRNVEKSGAVTGTTYFTGSTLDLRSGYINALYRWGHIYMPFGVSYTGGVVGQPPVLLSSLSAGIGAQVGVGWAFNRYVVVEGLYRLMTLKGLETDDGMNSNQGNTGYLWGPQAGVKILF